MTLLGKTGLLGWVWADAKDLPVLQVTTQSHTEALRAPAGVFLCVALPAEPYYWCCGVSYSPFLWGLRSQEKRSQEAEGGRAR